MNAYTALMGYLTQIPEHERGTDEILAHIANQAQSPRITDLVYARHFGTGPTVHQKLESLRSRKLVRLVTSKEDARAKIVVITNEGLEHLGQRNKRIKEVIKGIA